MLSPSPIRKHSTASIYNIFLSWLIVSTHVALAATGNQTNSKPVVDATGASYDPESFSKPKLNVRELFGSRWALNQKNKITVYHSLDISDATLIHENHLTLR